MTVGLRGKVHATTAVAVLLWALVGVLAGTTFAHNTNTNPYVDPTAYDKPRLSLRHHIPLAQTEEEKEISDDLAIQLRGGKEAATEIARQYGLEYLYQVFEDPPVFHLRRPSPSDNNHTRLKREVEERKLVEAIAKEPGVEWVDQQVPFTREKRRHYGNYFSIAEQQKRRLYENFHHKVPADRGRTRQALRRVVQGSLKNEYGEDQHRFKGNSKTNGFWKVNSKTEEVISEERRQNNHNSNPGGHKSSTSFSGDNFVRVPLSRSSGYGFGPVPNLQNLEQSGQYDKINEESVGHLYIPRDRQLKMAIDKLLTDDLKIDEEGFKRREFNPQNVHRRDPYIDFNDPYYKDQWYLYNKGQLGREGYDLNVTWPWSNGFTGRGVVLSVLDDGLQTTNADIADNYDPDISYSLIKDRNKRDDPSPRLDSSLSNSHGTYCAGIMSAVSNNSVCGVGVAYHSKIGGVRLVDGKVTDVQEATALSRHIDKVDIFSASWGPTDDGTKVEGPARLASHAFKEGVAKGRNGKGVIYVWASGNGGVLNDNCNLDGYTSSIYTLSVSALTDLGTSTFYEEPCASTLASVYVGGDHTVQEAKFRKERHKKSLTVVVPELDGHCSANFQGTSAAAPLMAGVLALVLQANGELTWRDVQHLVVETSSPTPNALKERGWNVNGRGKKFHLMQGFGAVNAGKMVEAALNWENVKPQKAIVAPMFSGYGDIKPYAWRNTTAEVDGSDVQSGGRMTAVEHVIANITLEHPQRKLLTIFIVSPSGTTSQVLTHRSPDESTSGFRTWGFMSVHFWGEVPDGTWKVAIKDDSGKKGFLRYLELTIYGS